MILLGRVKLFQFFYLSHYFGWSSLVFPLLLHLGQRLFDAFVLFLVAFLVENDGAILSACVIPLAVESRRIMNVHEDVKES